MTPPPVPRPSAAAVVVAAVWAAAFGALVWLVGWHVTGLPWADDWTLVPVRVGHEPLTLGWLWRPYAEHRIPLPKLLQIGLYEALGQDAPAGTWFTAAVFGFLSLATARVAAAVRGHASVTDAFFPLIWLQWGQAETLLHNFQVQYSAAMIPIVAALAVIVLRATRMTWPAGLTAGAGAALLPLCGGNGVIAALPLTGWLVLAVAANWGRPEMGGRAGSAAVAATVAVAVGVTAAYFVGYSPPAVPRSAETWGLVSLVFVSTMFGPVPQPRWVEASFAGVGVCVAAVAAAAVGVARDRREWLRALGLVCFVVTLFGYAAGVGRQRSGANVTDAIQSRYATLAVPTWCAVYFMAELYLRGRAGRAVRYGLLAAAAGIYFGHIGTGLAWTREYAAKRVLYLRDLNAGVPSLPLAEAHHGTPFGLCNNFPQDLDRGQLLLRDAGVGPFVRLVPNPPYRVVPADVAGGRFDPSRTAYTLPAARRVYGVKFRWAFATAYVGQPARVAWRSPEGVESDGGAAFPVDHRPQFVWIDAVVDRVRFSLVSGAGELPVKDFVLYVGD